MYEFATFKMSEMIECGSAIRRLGTGVHNMEEAAGRIVRYLYDHFGDRRTGARACALVRLYKTCPYEGLDDELKPFARSLFGGVEAAPETKCLTLLATAGDKPAWNSRKTSVGHKAIPLPSAQVVSQAPMISRLIVQFGLDIADVVKPEAALLLELEQRTFNVFHVEEAAGSPFVPAQRDFVVPFGIRSVLGFGGGASGRKLDGNHHVLQGAYPEGKSRHVQDIVVERETCRAALCGRNDFRVARRGPEERR